jgi:ectoine hydroxylase
MTPDEILAREPLALTSTQREKYFVDGYLGAPSLVDSRWMSRLNQVTQEFVDVSRTLSGKDHRFDLEPDHTPDSPRIRRLNSPVEIHDTYWEFASQGPFADVAEDLLGPDVKFNHSKLNFKWSGGGEEVKWHQDIQFWPHTNYDVLTIGVYLSDVDADMAPMGVLPGAHEVQLYDLYDENDQWTGNLRDDDVAGLDLSKAEYLGGPAGSVTVHNCRAIHGSPPNLSERPRPLLLCAYSAADAIPITSLNRGASHSEAMVRGQSARWARFDSRPCLMPPDWSKGYKSIFAYQQADQ